MCRDIFAVEKKESSQEIIVDELIFVCVKRRKKFKHLTSIEEEKKFCVFESN